LHSALAALGVAETIEFFESEGVATKVEPTGKVFPVSNRALDVLNALLHRLKRSGAELVLGEPVQEIRQREEGFNVSTSSRVLGTRRIILTTGGQSYPGSGTTGDGYGFASKMGHTIVPPRPALVPITVSATWIPKLRGVTISDVYVQVLEDDKRLAARRGSLLFAHFGLSGPVILDVSRAVSGHARPEALALAIDFCPDISESSLHDFLRNEASLSGKKQLASALSSYFPRRLAEAMTELAGMASDRQMAGLSKNQREEIVRQVKQLRLGIRGTLGFSKAEVTAGGVALDEIDSRTMESRIVPGLFIAGEVLDLDGPIGGYNFQAAFSTGWLAGESL
jgi:predicted Rossmann fold flavoprotein